MSNTINTITPAADLTATEEKSLVHAQNRYAATWTLGSSYHAERALTFREQYRFTRQVGKLALENHVEKAMAFKVDTVRGTGFKVCAMGVTGINIYAEKNDELRKALENKVQPVTQALDALTHFHDDHDAKSDAEFVSWWHEQGRLSGLHAKFKAATSTKKIAQEPDEAAIGLAVDALLANQTGFEVDAVPDLVAGNVAVYVAQGVGDKTRLVRLDVDQGFIASLADKAPDPMTNAPAALLFWRQLLQLGAAIIPDANSIYPVVSLKAGERADKNTAMLPANAIILVSKEGFSIASSRTSDTIVIEVAAPEKMEPYLIDEGYIDTKNRKAMEGKLRASSIAAGYIKADAVISSDHVVTFTHDTDEKLSGKLAMKPLDALGGVWTHRVGKWKGTCFAVLNSSVEDFDHQFLAQLVKTKDDHPVTITWSKEKLSLQHGRANPVSFDSETVDTGTAVVAKADFKRAMAGLLALDIEGELAIALDSRGLVKITAQTKEMDIHVYVQTLRDDGVRERTLLRRVEKTEVVADQLAA